MRIVASGRLSPSSRSHRSGARSRTSSDSGTAEVATNATPGVATAVRSSARISVATGSAVTGSSASMSVISSTPPPSRTVATADATLPSRSSARSAPTSGPSSSTRRRPAHTVRTMVALPTPAGPDTSTPRFGCGTKGFQQVGLVERELQPFGEPAGLRVGALQIVEADRGRGRLCRRGHHVLTRRRRWCGGDAVSPTDHRIRLHANGSGGVDAGDGQQLRCPRDADCRRQCAAGLRRRDVGAELTWQQRHGVADRHHLAQQGLAQGRRRDRLGGQVRAAYRHRPCPVHRHRCDQHGGVLPQACVGQRHIVEQRSAGWSSGRSHPRHRCGGARTGQRNRIPLPNAQGGNGFRMQPHHASAGVESRGVQSRRERELVPGCRAVGHVEPGHVRRPAYAGRVGPSSDDAAGPGESPAAPGVAPWACRPTPRGASTAMPSSARRTGCGSRRPR